SAGLHHHGTDKPIVEPTSELRPGEPGGVHDAPVAVGDSQLEDVLCQIHSNGRSIHGTDSFRFVSADTTPMRPAGTMMPNTDREESIPSLQRSGTHKLLGRGRVGAVLEQVMRARVLIGRRAVA